jgi:hypothetical protein
MTAPEAMEVDASGVTAPRTTTATPPVTHQPNTSQDDIQRITAYLSTKGATKVVEEAWERLRRSLLQPAERVEDSHVINAILEMKGEMEQMKLNIKEELQESREGMRIMDNKLTGLSLNSFPTTTASSGQTYASVAAAGPRKPGQTPIAAGIKPVPARLERELIIHTGDKTFQKTGAQIVQLVNDQMETGRALACRQLQSGDYHLTLDSKETKVLWEHQTSWLRVFGEKAKINAREFAIMAHGIVINQIQTQDQSVAIQKIYEQNPGLKERVKIVRVAWSRRTLRKWELRGKISNDKGPLILSMASPEQANHLIDNGLIWGYQIHDCEPYSSDCQVTQCYRCYKYGHTQRMCQAASRCGRCSEIGHKEEDCLVREDQTKWKCINCAQGGNNHTSWSHQCPVRQQKHQAARKAYQERPYRFQESTSHTPISNRSSVSPEPQLQQQPQPQPLRTEPLVPQEAAERLENEWQEVASRRRTAGSPLRGESPSKRGRRGAPPTSVRLQRAASQAGQERLNFTNQS